MNPMTGNVTPELVERLARELQHLPLLDGDAQTISDVLRSLAMEMRPTQQMNVGEREPATTYDASLA